MKDLIEKLQKAMGPDRELDYAIMFETDRDRFEYCDRRRIEMQAQAIANGLGGRDEACRRSAFDACPAFTRSLDAAVTLVPKGYCWQAKQGIQSEAIVWSLMGDYDDDGAPSGTQTTFPAIALCIAALHARVAVERDLTKMEAGG